MRFLLAILLAAAPLSPAMAQGAETSQERSQLGQVAGMLTSGRAAEAIEILDPIIARHDKRHADDPRLYFCADTVEESILLAAIAEETGKESVIVVGSPLCFALWAKGYALVELGRIPEALPYLERATAMAPLNSQYLSELGHVYQELKQWDKALAAFTQAADAAEFLKGDRRIRWLTRAWRGMGFNLIELRRWDEAEAMFNKALELDPNDAKAKNELAYIARHRPKK